MIILSKTPDPPFEVENPISDVLLTSDKKGIVESNINFVYIIIKQECVDTLEIRVEGDDTRGVSLFISKAESTNFNWTKKLTYRDISAPVGYTKILIAYQWKVIIDDKLNEGRGKGRINIYKLEKEC